MSGKKRSFSIYAKIIFFKYDSEEDVDWDAAEPAAKRQRLTMSTTIPTKVATSTPFQLIQSVYSSSYCPCLACIVGSTLTISNYIDVKFKIDISGVYLWSPMYFDKNDRDCYVNDVFNEDRFVTKMINNVLKLIPRSRKFRYCKKLSKLMEQHEKVCFSVVVFFLLE